MANLVNAEGLAKAYGTKTLLAGVSLGLARGDVIGVVGRNGDGKTTLLSILTGLVEPDSGTVTRTKNASIGYLTQVDDFDDSATVRELIVGGRADHAWAADPVSRAIVGSLLAEIDLDSPIGSFSGGERRRVALTQLLLGGHDLIVLDEPTNHLDIEAIGWLAEQLNAVTSRGTAALVVSHDRWFLDAVCNRVWEVHDGQVDAYEGGYAAYVLARAERARQEAATEARRQNLLRKELAWLRRGPPARTSKPRFRIAAANALIEGEPPPRDSLGLQRFATTRLGKDVFDLHGVSLALPDGRKLLDRVSWSIGPGDRIGIVGVNGAGKTTLLDVLTGAREIDAGKVKRGQTLRVAQLTQAVAELDDTDTVLANVTRLKQVTKLATGREATASSLLEDFGFRGETLVSRIGDLSGGERRRLQFLRLLLTEPNVLLLDEPTNDLDIDTLTIIEDYLDTWPGTLIIVTHDRYFLERVCDVTYALRGDGSCVLLPGGIDQYLAERAAQEVESDTTERSAARLAVAEPGAGTGLTPARERQLKKDIARIEGQLAKASDRITDLHLKMTKHAADFEKLTSLQQRLDDELSRQDALELEWLEVSSELE